MSQMQLTFHGAVEGQVTGSMHLLECAGARFLFDAGLFQGRRGEADQRNRALDVEPRTLNAVVLSHAHIDHSGRLPLLVREGYHAPIYATPATRDLCAVMLADSAESETVQAYGGSGFPFAVILDSEGNVVARQSGSTSPDQIVAWLELAAAAG